MVNGNYILYGDRPSSESEIVDDHVQTRTAERKNKRKSSRNANELQRTLNMAQLDNETDSVKYEKKIKEPRLLRYVPTTDVEENFVTEKFETYDLKPTEERPRRYAFQKKPKNPSDGSVNYAYSRSSSSCSSPNGNLPTISEHVEQYSTYRVQNIPCPKDSDIINGYESKMDKYFYKPKDTKKISSKVNYHGSHPDSLYRVGPNSVTGVDKMAKWLRIMRWPIALVIVCIALAVFVYFLMPENINTELDVINGTYWEPIAAGAHNHENHKTPEPPRHKHPMHTKKQEINPTHNLDTKTTEIDFYDAENDKNADLTTLIDTITETSHRILPIKPVFPSHITPEVQYGNERADVDKLRTPKALEEGSTLPDDSTLKPHITQKPEKPLAVYFKDLNEATTTTTEFITRAETVNDYSNYGDKGIYTNYGDKQTHVYTNHGEKQTTKKIEVPTKSNPAVYKNYGAPVVKTKPQNIKQYLVPEPELPLEVSEYYGSHMNMDANFTSGHSKLFGISIEDAEKMKSTTQNSLYNTRVSPTLPNWRDSDDTTTKKYPINANYEVPVCRSTRLPLCREILPYDLAGSPATISGVEVTSMMSQIEYLVATNCSARVRHFTCALLEPECNPPPYPARLPCYNLCKAIVDSCEGLIPRELSAAFNCQQYSKTNCVAAKSPCFPREMSCGDGSCIPRDWICDGTEDCAGGEDESVCSSVCERHEYRCKTGGCILKRWLCDGYADCPGGEDETEACDHHEVGEPGEESAGSAPAPAVRRPNRVSSTRDLRKTGENDSSKELLVTSDSNNAFKRNFTRRPPLSRLTPYSRTTPVPNLKAVSKEHSVPRKIENEKKEVMETTQKPQEHDSMEEVNIGDLGFFEDLHKLHKEEIAKYNEQKPLVRTKNTETKPRAVSPGPPGAKLDKSINKFEKVINGAALLKKAQADEQDMDSPETNGTTIEMNDDTPSNTQDMTGRTITSSHVSPCPSDELRCVDGRCISLAQLCDGTIDCSDHADEDNCYT